MLGVSWSLIGRIGVGVATLLGAIAASIVIYQFAFTATASLTAQIYPAPFRVPFSPFDRRLTLPPSSEALVPIITDWAKELDEFGTQGELDKRVDSLSVRLLAQELSDAVWNANEEFRAVLDTIARSGGYVVAEIKNDGAKRLTGVRFRTDDALLYAKRVGIADVVVLSHDDQGCVIGDCLCLDAVRFGLSELVFGRGIVLGIPCGRGRTSRDPYPSESFSRVVRAKFFSASCFGHG